MNTRKYIAVLLLLSIVLSSYDKSNKGNDFVRRSESKAEAPHPTLLLPWVGNFVPRDFVPLKIVL